MNGYAEMQPIFYKDKINKIYIQIKLIFVNASLAVLSSYRWRLAVGDVEAEQVSR